MHEIRWNVTRSYLTEWFFTLSHWNDSLSLSLSLSFSLVLTEKIRFTNEYLLLIFSGERHQLSNNSKCTRYFHVLCLLCEIFLRLLVPDCVRNIKHISPEKNGIHTATTKANKHTHISLSLSACQDLFVVWITIELARVKGANKIRCFLCALRWMSVGSFELRTKYLLNFSAGSARLCVLVFFLSGIPWDFSHLVFAKETNFYVTRIYIFVCLNLATFFFLSPQLSQHDKLKLSTHTRFDIACQCGCRCVWNIVVEWTNQMCLCSSGVNFVESIVCVCLCIHFKTRVKYMKLYNQDRIHAWNIVKFFFSDFPWYIRWCYPTSDLIVPFDLVEMNEYFYTFWPSICLLCLGFWILYLLKCYKIVQSFDMKNWIDRDTQNGQNFLDNFFRFVCFDFSLFWSLEFAINFIVGTILQSKWNGKKLAIRWQKANGYSKALQIEMNVH